MSKLLNDEQKEIMKKVFDKNLPFPEMVENIREWGSELSDFLVNELGMHFIAIQIGPVEPVEGDPTLDYIHCLEGCGQCLSAAHLHGFQPKSSWTSARCAASRAGDGADWFNT